MRCDMNSIKNFLESENAQGMTEYVLLVFLIAIAAYVAVQNYGKKLDGKYVGAGNKFETLH